MNQNLGRCFRTEPLTYCTITKRLMLVDQIGININEKVGDIIKTYCIPEMLYKDNTESSLIQFETFFYRRLDVELHRIMVNTNNGMIVVSYE